MHYDPIKLNLARLVQQPTGRRAFHLALDWLFLRAWYVRRELRRLKRAKVSKNEWLALDAGMGFGQYTDRMLRMFRDSRVVGLELDREHFYGGERYFQAIHRNAHLVLGDVQRLPLRAGIFDLVLTVDVMEHIPDDEAAFREFARVLKWGGVLVMHTPRAYVGKGQATKRRNWTVGEHVREGYAEPEALQKLARAGLKVERAVRGYGVPGRAAWALLQMVPLKMLAAGKWMLPVAALFILAALPVAVALMAWDAAVGDHPSGGALLVTAVKTGPEGAK